MGDDGERHGSLQEHLARLRDALLDESAARQAGTARQRDVHESIEKIRLLTGEMRQAAEVGVVDASRRDETAKKVDDEPLKGRQLSVLGVTTEVLDQAQRLVERILRWLVALLVGHDADATAATPGGAS